LTPKIALGNIKRDLGRTAGLFRCCERGKALQDTEREILMSEPIRVIQYGLGAIGRAAARLAADRPGIKLVGAVDRDPKLTGKDLGEILGLDRKLGVALTISRSFYLRRRS